MVGRDGRVQRWYEGERRGLPGKDETSAKRVQSADAIKYGEVVVEASNSSSGNEGSQEGMTGGEMSGRLHTIDGQQEEARLSSAINGPWRGESRR